MDICDFLEIDRRDIDTSGFLSPEYEENPPQVPVKSVRVLSKNEHRSLNLNYLLFTID